MSPVVVTCFKVCVLLSLYSEGTSGSEVVTHFKPCPDNYTAVDANCYKVEEISSYKDRRCKYVDIGSQVENEYIKGILNKIGDESIWISKPRGRYYNWEGYRRTGDCYIMKRNGKWKALKWYSCGGHRRAVCELHRGCEKTWVGNNCDRQCHCYKESCDSFYSACIYGCEPGWVGTLCDKETPKPQIEHFCFKNSSHYTLMLTMELGNYYKSLVPIDAEGFPFNPDQFTDDYNTGRNVLELTTDDLSNPFHPNYYEKKIGGPGATFEWSFRLRELNSVRLPNDMDFRVQCNFSEVDMWYSSVSLDFKTVPFAEHTPVPRQMTVEMFLTEPDEIEPMSNITVGQPVRLALSQGLDGSDNTKPVLSPRNCVARSRDDKVTRRLSDVDGCPLEKDIFKEFQKRSSGEMITGFFRAFALPGYSTYYISCDLVTCSSNRDYECLDPCRSRGYRRARSVYQGITEQLFSDVRTTVNVT